MTRCWVRRDEEGIYVLAWYLLPDGSWVHLSRTYGLKYAKIGLFEPFYTERLLSDLESSRNWEEVRFSPNLR